MSTGELNMSKFFPYDSRIFAFNISTKDNNFSLEINEMKEDVFSVDFDKFDVNKYNNSILYSTFFDLKIGEITSMCLNSFLDMNFLIKNIEYAEKMFFKIVFKNGKSVPKLFEKVTELSRTEEHRVLSAHLSKYVRENIDNTENIIHNYLYNEKMLEKSLNFVNYTHYSPQFQEEVLYLKSFDDVVKYDMINLFKKNIKINICENCGQYFVPIKRNDEKYCNFNYLNGKSCRDVGYENKVNANEILKTYRTIYKTQNARKQRNKDNIIDIENKFRKWTVYAKEQLNLCQNGKIDLEQMKANISKNDWLK